MKKKSELVCRRSGGRLKKKISILNGEGGEKSFVVSCGSYRVGEGKKMMDKAGRGENL